MAAALLGTAVVGACAEKKGALMLAINTDMKAPKDVNAVSVTISTNGAIKHSFIGRVTPQGEVLLPATLAIVEPEDASNSIRIRVMAFQDRKPRVLRDVRTTVPAGGRVALLRIPLNFVNDASAIGASLPNGIVPDPIPGTAGTSSGGLDSGTGGGSSGGDNGGVYGASAADYDFFGAFQPPCPDIEHQTIIDGECKDNFVDPAALPEFDSAALGDSADKGSCFSVAQCFATSLAVGDATNVAPVGDGGTSIGDGGDDGCPAPKISCGGQCVDTSSDPKNCGGCERPCPSNATCNDGKCASGELDAGGFKFKDLRPSLITLQRDECSLQLNGANPARLNIALVTPDTGECVRPGECYVPLDRSTVPDGSGWYADPNGQVVKLPSFVCKLLTGKSLRLATSAETCAAKEDRNPLCVPKAGEIVPEDRPDASFDGPTECKQPNTPCQQPAECCTLSCVTGVCAATSFCVQNGLGCTADPQCCSGVCDDATFTCGGTTSNDSGVVVPPGPAVPGAPCGSELCGDVCGGKSCAKYGASGARVCQVPSGCRPTSELCAQDSDCCGWSGANPPVVGAPSSCAKQNAADPVGRCSNGSSCREAGSVCKTTAISQWACSAQDNCCPPNGPVVDCSSNPGACCGSDALGVPRCLLNIVDCMVPPAQGTTCATSADCCGNPCVNHLCGAPGSCVAQGNTCSSTSDCCAGLPCNAPPGSTTGTCGGSITACSLPGQICAVGGDCCNAIPCLGGRCRNELP